jgi:molybdate transport system ATP-binding protein
VIATDFIDIDPNRFAAVLYRPEDDIDALLADFARERLRCGDRVGGIVQINITNAAGQQTDMQAIDLMSGQLIRLYQPLGSGAMSCKLDPGGLAEAAVAVTRAVAQDLDLIVINKFSKQESAGDGLRSEFAEAILAGIPVLTAVPERCFDAWLDFTGGRGTTLLCARHVIDEWWRDVSSQTAKRRDATSADSTAATTSRSSHPMT